MLQFISKTNSCHSLMCLLTKLINILSSTLNLDCFEVEVVSFVVLATEVAGSYLAQDLQNMACLLVENSNSSLIFYT